MSLLLPTSFSILTSRDSKYFAYFGIAMISYQVVLNSCRKNEHCSDLGTLEVKCGSVLEW